MSLLQSAIDRAASAEEIARAAVKDAVADATTDKEKEKLARDLYKEATGRFPQESSDRRVVYVGGLVLLGFVFLVTAVVASVIILKGGTVPDWLAVLATALVSGLLGGLFGYAQQ